MKPTDGQESTGSAASVDNSNNNVNGEEVSQVFFLN